MSKQEVRHLGNSEPNAIHRMLVSKPAVAAQEREQSCWREVPEDICPMCGWNHKKTTNSKRVKKQKQNTRHHLILIFLTKVSYPHQYNSVFPCGWASRHEIQHFSSNGAQVILSKTLCQPVENARMNMTGYRLEFEEEF